MCWKRSRRRSTPSRRKRRTWRCRTWCVSGRSSATQGPRGSAESTPRVWYYFLQSRAAHSKAGGVGIRVAVNRVCTLTGVICDSPGSPIRTIGLSRRRRRHPTPRSRLVSARESFGWRGAYLRDIIALLVLIIIILSLHARIFIIIYYYYYYGCCCFAHVICAVWLRVILCRRIDLEVRVPPISTPPPYYSLGLVGLDFNTLIPEKNYDNNNIHYIGTYKVITVSCNTAFRGKYCVTMYTVCSCSSIL